MPDRNFPEDPIEAIKRRNEERAAKLREKLAAEGVETFETSINGTEEAKAAAADEFDLGSFPSPPEPEDIPVGKEPAAVEEPRVTPAPPTGRDTPDIELPPPPGAAEVRVPDIGIPPSAPDVEIEITPAASVTEPSPPETFTGVPELDIEVTPPDVTEIPMAPEGAAKIMDADLGEEEFPVPEAWEGIAETPMGAPIEPPEPVAAETAAEIVPEIPPSAEEIEPSIMEGFELPEIPTVEVPMGEIAEPLEIPTGEPEMAPAEAPTPPEPPEVISVGPPPEPVKVFAEEPPAVEPTVAEPGEVREPVEEPVEEELTIKVAVEVKGTKVRIARENIALDGAVDLFRKIIERYENR
jgi:hypothetical protein